MRSLLIALGIVVVAALGLVGPDLLRGALAANTQPIAQQRGSASAASGEPSATDVATSAAVAAERGAQRARTSQSHDLPLPQDLEVALRRSGLPASAVSFYAEAVDSNIARAGSSNVAFGASGTDPTDERALALLPLAAPVLSWQAEVPRNPASVIKLVTSLVALDELGPTYVWSTEFLATAPVVNGTLDGDLVLRGHGDPYLMAQDAWTMVRALRKTGLKTITGSLIVDDTYFQLPPEDPAAFDGRPNKPYNTLPSAVLLNLKYLELTLRPDGNTARFETDPPISSLDVVSDVRLTNDACSRGRRNGVQLQIPEPATANTVRVTGVYPRRCGPITWTRTLMTHDRYALGLFTALWREMGGEFRGQQKPGPVPASARVVLRWTGRPLADSIRPMNKSSNNVMARQLLLTLGAERYGPPATPQKGAQAVADYVTRLGMDPIAVHVVNGSGLSRDERVTARLLGSLLVRGARMPFAAEFISSLSVAGYDGTTRRRFRGREEAGAMHLKSGRLNDVAGLAGYVRARSGRMYVVVGFVNHPGVARGVGEPLLNALVQSVYRR